MRGTDPTIGAPTQLLAATIAAGFASVAAVLALALTGSFLTTLVAGATPIVVVLVGSLDFTSTPDPIRESRQTKFNSDMTAELSSDGGIDDK